MPPCGQQNQHPHKWTLLFLAAVLCGSGLLSFILYQQLLMAQLNVQTIQTAAEGLSPETVKNRLIIFASLLLIGGIAILTGFTYLQCKFGNPASGLIKHLINQLERTTPEQRPGALRIGAFNTPEAGRLADAFSTMTNRFYDSLSNANQFNANLTHELRTPLTILRGETELALMNDRDPAQLRAALQSNLDEIKRMGLLIEDLLYLAKSDQGELPLNLESLSLRALLGELQRKAQMLADSKQITVDLQLPNPAMRLRADELRLREALLNLLSNAIKYTPEQGRVTISAQETPGQIALSVSDNGIGIDSNLLERIFERFYRVDKARNCSDGGSGLGLSIVKWVAEVHGGRVQVQSIPGQGSKFSIVLPQKTDTGN
ncbi:MAG: hypothetical protein C0622_13240 [Desulfuromonas sp.]|nr:MAG: hypothetical protein C0622_13240 [Desulfuromonas sp.]